MMGCSCLQARLQGIHKNVINAVLADVGYKLGDMENDNWRNFMNKLIIITLAACVFLTVTQPDFLASGQPLRSEINLNEDRVESAEKRIVVLTDLIIKQHKIIDEKEKLLQDAREELRKTKAESGKSWDALLSLEGKENGVTDALNSLKNSKTQLLNYLTERSDLHGIIKSLEKQLSLDKENLAESTRSKVKLLGIQLSRSCQMSDNCIKYSDIIHLDTSNQYASGKFVTVNNDTFREKSPFEKSWRFYDNDPTPRIFIDPPQGMNDVIKMITVTNILPIYFEPGDLTINNQTRSYSENRYVDNCRKALITSDLVLLNDTIKHFQNDCGVTEIETRVTVPLNRTEIDITTSPNWQYQQWLTNTKERCIALC